MLRIPKRSQLVLTAHNCLNRIGITSLPLEKDLGGGAICVHLRAFDEISHKVAFFP